MAVILRGKRKGKIVKIHQYCNDWFTVEDDVMPVSPLSIRLFPKEQAMVLESEEKGQCGIMFKIFTLDEKGFFHKRKWE